MTWPPNPVRPPTAEQDAADRAAIATAGLDVGEYEPIYSAEDSLAVMNGEIGAASRHKNALVATEDTTVDYAGEPVELKAGKTLIWPDHKLATTQPILFRPRRAVQAQNPRPSDQQRPIRARSSIGVRRSRGTRRRQSASRASPDSDSGEPGEDDSDARLARALRRSRAPPVRSRTSGCVATVTAACAFSPERPRPG